MADELDFNIKLNEEETIPEVKAEEQSFQKQSISQQSTVPSENIAPKSNFDISAAGHPIACVFTFVFKVAAVLCYFLMNLAVDDKIYTFIVILLLTCLDFWTVKNVTARFLVGLKWWNEFDDNGKEIWFYESMPPEWQAHPIDKTIFWTAQFISTVFFIVMLFIKVLSLDIFWSLLNLICVVLYGTNLYGFYKCRGQHQKKVKEFMGIMGLKVLTGGF